MTRRLHTSAALFATTLAVLTASAGLTAPTAGAMTALENLDHIGGGPESCAFRRVPLTPGRYVVHGHVNRANWQAGAKWTSGMSVQVPRNTGYIWRICLRLSSGRIQGAITLKAEDGPRWGWSGKVSIPTRSGPGSYDYGSLLRRPWDTRDIPSDIR